MDADTDKLECWLKDKFNRDGEQKCVEVTEEDFCFGCKKYICEQHMVNAIFGSHDPMEHVDDLEAEVEE